MWSTIKEWHIFCPKPWLFGKVPVHCFTGPLRDWELRAHPSEEQSLIVQNVLQMGFDPTWVTNLVENKFAQTGTFYLSESELVSDLVHSGCGASSSPGESRGRPDSQLGWGCLTSSSLPLEHCWSILSFCLHSAWAGIERVMPPNLPFLGRLSNEVLEKLWSLGCQGLCLPALGCGGDILGASCCSQTCSNWQLHDV